MRKLAILGVMCTSLAVAVGVSGPLSGPEPLRLDFVNNNGFEQVTGKGEIRNWTYNPYSRTFNGGGSFVSADGSRGKCAHAVTGAGQRVYVYSSALARIQPGRDVMVVTCQVKGKGTMAMSLYGYNEVGRNVDGWSSPSQKVDSPSWRQVTFRCAVTAASGKSVGGRPVLSFFEHSDLCLDDVSIVFARTLPQADK